MVPFFDSLAVDAICEVGEIIGEYWDENLQMVLYGVSRVLPFSLKHY